MIQIANCTEGKCPKDWNKLEKSGESHLPVCIICVRKVTDIKSIDFLAARSKTGEKAAINI